jgi:hypothetical protein
LFPSASWWRILFVVLWAEVFSKSFQHASLLGTDSLKAFAIFLQMLHKKTAEPMKHVLVQGNLYTRGRGWYCRWSHQPTVEMAVGLMTKYSQLL